METTLNNTKVQEAAKANETALLVSKSLAARKRMRHFTDINRTETQLKRAGNPVVHPDFIKYWKDLQAAGAGSIVYGRKGNPDRFMWKYDLKTVSHIALTQSSKETPQALEPVKKIGRPKGSKNKKMVATATGKSKRPKRGRPKGSKNKLRRAELRAVYKALKQMFG